MAHTIGQEEWEYLQTLNMCIQLLLTTLLGALAGYCNIFEADRFLPQSTTYVFYAALPCLVVNALGIKIDLYSEAFLWDFIFVFLILRALALVVAVMIVLFQPHKGIGDVAVLWIASTWISTIILGVPIAGAVFGNPVIGAKYGILAGISSFIFQLPLQLFFLECHVLEKDYLEEHSAVEPELDSTNGDDLESGSVNESRPNEEGAEPAKTAATRDEDLPPPESNRSDALSRPDRLRLWAKFASKPDVWRKIVCDHIARNPVLWAIAVGFVLTLSTLGPKYLNDSSDDFVPGLGWISDTLHFLGSTTTPVSLFAMGVWIEKQGPRGLFSKLSPLTAIACMLAKLLFVPLLMLGLSKALDLGDEQGRAAVLIAALPISMASFSLVNRYGIGEALMAENVALGTLLILPTVIAWNVVMDATGMFPLSNIKS